MVSYIAIFWYIYFCLKSVKYKSISIKIGMQVCMSWKKYLTKSCKNCQHHLKYVLALPWEIWGVILTEPSTQYVHVHFNESLNSQPQARLVVIVSIVKRLVNYISFTLRARNVHLQQVLRSQMSTNWDDTSKTSEQSESCCSLNMRWSDSHLWSLGLCRMQWHTLLLVLIGINMSCQLCSSFIGY